jgi:nucleotide-binding universal stress UspA family protein
MAAGTGTAGAGSRVVVGVDGSPGGRAALVWALAAAARAGASLRVVAAFPVEIYWGDPVLVDPRHVEDVRADTEARARGLVDEVRGEHPGGPAGAAEVPVEIMALPGPAARELVLAADGADLLVVGSRGRGAVRSTVLGSVALHCVTHARCPVVVVRPRTEAGGTPARVVVGLDGSETSQHALDRALVEAGRLGAAVTAVAAYSPESYWSDAYEVFIPPAEQLREDAQRGAEAAVARAREAAGAGAPEVDARAVEGAAGDVLVREAEGAELLVVGGRGHGALRELLLGSIALHCVLHAPCPVMVVPAAR